MKPAWLPVSLVRGIRCCPIPRPTIPKSLPRQRSLLPSSRFLTTSSEPAKITAADPIEFPEDLNTSNSARLDDVYIRLVPVSPSYFTGSPSFTDNLVYLEALLRKYSKLPTVKSADAPRVSWRTMLDYRNTVGEPIKTSKYHKIVHVLQRLNQIHPSLMPAEVKASLNEYKRVIDPLQNVAKPIKIDQFGRALGVGRRKTSTARAWVVEGTGEALINGKPLTEMFARVHDRESAMWALKSTDRMDKYNVWALVEGGGTTGQAEAMTLAVAKALMAHEPGLKPALRRAGCVTRDPRKVERKKPGHVKARKMPAWVKR